ncbi:YqaA family protein [Terrihabitans sp. B22-R8]|uniref:YqaA family protein n=1 Tax=Terrihabitans sp. B22-R8 TaxID=3425128 RepID=UPI00403C4E9D
MFRSLYARTMALASHRHAEPALAAVTFAESSFFPVPPDVMLIPMVLARPERTWRYALICTITSVLGGIAGYAIGYFLFETVGQAILDFYGLADEFETIAEKYNDVGWLMVLLGGGITPLPYKIITIASGLTRLDFLTFVIMSVLARGVRFFLTCALLKWGGPRAKTFMEEKSGWAFAIIIAVIVAGVFATKFAFS